MIEYKKKKRTKTTKSHIEVMHNQALVGVITFETDFYKFTAYTNLFANIVRINEKQIKEEIECQAAKISYTRVKQYNAYIVDITRTINEQHAIIAELPDNAYKTQLLKSIDQTNKLIEKTTLQDI